MAARPAPKTTHTAIRLSADGELVGRPQASRSGKGRGYAKLENKSRAIHDSLSGVVAETQALMRRLASSRMRRRPSSTSP